MANFVGVVTQQDVPTGVTLRARVTSPKGHYTAFQNFKCMIKKSGLTDEQAVMTDLNTVSNRLLVNGVTGITSNLTSYMPSAGENETSITYAVTGDEIKDYFNSDGIVIKRPSYGANAIVGSLTITVKKNAAVAERNITVSVEPYTLQELSQSALNMITWDAIRGTNGIETTDVTTNGMYNVIHPLKLMTSLTSELVDKPIKVSWNVTNDALSSVVGSVSRIDISTGDITRPDYSEIYEQKDSGISSTYLETITSKIENTFGDTYFRISGLTLEATIEIEGIDLTTIPNSVTFNLKTLSAALTNKEVNEYLTENISLFNIKDTKYSTLYSLSTINDTTERIVFFDTTGANSSTLELYGVSAIASATASNPFTNSSINVTNIRWRTIDPATVGTSSVSPIPQTEYSTLGIQINEFNSTLTLDPIATPSVDKLILECIIGLNANDGTISYFTAYYRFSLDDLTPATPVTPPTTP